MSFWKIFQLLHLAQKSFKNFYTKICQKIASHSYIKMGDFETAAFVSSNRTKIAPIFCCVQKFGGFDNKKSRNRLLRDF